MGVFDAVVHSFSTVAIGGKEKISDHNHGRETNQNNIGFEFRIMPVGNRVMTSPDGKMQRIIDPRYQHKHNCDGFDCDIIKITNAGIMR